MFINRSLAKAVISLVLLSGLLLPASVYAQFSPDIYGATRPLTGEQLTKVKDFVTKQVELIAGADTKEVRNANKTLAEPLMNPKASRTFRLAYSDVITPLLAAILESKESRIHAKISALHMLGNVATDDSINVVEKYIENDVDAIRYAAASGYQRAFEAYQSARATYDATKRLPEMTKLLRGAIEIERQPVVLFAYANACASAPGVDGAALAIENIGKGLQIQFKDMYAVGLDNRFNRYTSCINLMLRRYYALIGTGKDIKLAKTTLIETSITGILLTLELAENEELTQPLKDQCIEMVQVCENILNVIYHNAKNEDTIVSETFTKGQFSVAKNLFEKQWLADNGPIFDHSEFGFKPGHFKRILGM